MSLSPHKAALTVGETIMENYEEYTDSLFDIPEYRFAEFREVEGRTIYGNAIVYGDVSLRPHGGKEMFMPGAFGMLAHWIQSCISSMNAPAHSPEHKAAG